MNHIHHIIPKYRCKELGINPDFLDNLVEVSRHQHALIHWGYKCNDLTPLLDVCNPPQYVIDMIPLGDARDASCSLLLAQGEIDGLEPVYGEEHPAYKHGIMVNQKEWHDARREGRLGEIDKSEWNAAQREWKKRSRELNDEYAQREKKRKLENVHRWPSTQKRLEEQKKRHERIHGTSNLEEFM